jgi:polygalacturonase
MTTYPRPQDPTTAFTRADGSTEAHDIDHGRIIGMWENVKHHGAKGDGSTDDTTAINAAITATASTGGVVYFPPGVYVHTGLTMTTNTRLVGSLAVVSEFAPATSGVILKYTGAGAAIAVTANANHNGPSVEHIGMLGPSAGGSTIGLFVDGSGSVMQVGSIKSVRAKGFGTGIKLNNTYQTSLLDCYADGNGIGLQFTNNANANSVLGGGYRENVTGINITGGSASIFVSPATTVESNSATGLLVDGSAATSGLVLGGHYENNPRGIYFNPSTTAQDSHISGALIDTSSTAALELQNTHNVIADIITTDTSSIVLGAGTLNCHIRTTRRPTTYTDSGSQNTLQHGNAAGQGFWYFGLGTNGGIHLTGAIKMTEMTDPFGAPDADTAHMMLRDNGSGKSQLVIRFASGATQVIATQP